MNTNSSDKLIFVNEDSDHFLKSSLKPWRIMIVDDEPGIHDITKLVLKGVKFSDRPLEFVDCYSGAEACKAMERESDIAIMLLDVVMETDDAGLNVARYVRETIKNYDVRIVLRTGQPGQAPERDVITSFDINDYKEKTELTSSKLFSLIYSSLRAYRDITTIAASKKGLSLVIEASANIFKLNGMESFARGVLEQLSALVQAYPGAVYLKSKNDFGALAVRYDLNHWQVLAGSGSYASIDSNNVKFDFTKNHSEILDVVIKEKKSVHLNRNYAAFFEDRNKNINVILMDGIDVIDRVESDLIQLFMRNVSIAFENINLQDDLEETQREIVCLLGESVERRSKETGNHVRRVAAISEVLALACGLSNEEAQILKYASPLHDLGKIAIPDMILNKKGSHTPEETAIMREHAAIGYQMLAPSKRKVLRAAATIAHEHHERWDGAGYPRQLSGNEIHIYGRITAIADVFDALSNDRCYKKAWPIEKVLELFSAERGRQFDPSLVDLLFEKLDLIKNIQLEYKDLFEEPAINLQVK
jgi:response regulator RpfG family c-di-GMP phosphodiesterase